jgi:hypothetical protein
VFSKCVLCESASVYGPDVHVACMVNYCESEKSASRFWRIHTCVASQNTKEYFLKIRLYVCMSSSLASELLDGFYSYLECKSSFAMGRCLVNMNILAPEIEVPQMGHKTKLRLSLKRLCDSDKIYVIYGCNLHKPNCIFCFLWKIMVRAVGAQMQNVGYV